MKSFNVLKVLLQFLLIIALVILTYLRFDKLSQEETSMTYSTVSKEIYLPSVTICFRACLAFKNEKAQYHVFIIDIYTVSM